MVNPIFSRSVKEISARRPDLHVKMIGEFRSGIFTPYFLRKFSELSCVNSVTTRFTEKQLLFIYFRRDVVYTSMYWYRRNESNTTLTPMNCLHLHAACFKHVNVVRRQKRKKSVKEHCKTFRSYDHTILCTKKLNHKFCCLNQKVSKWYIFKEKSKDKKIIKGNVFRCCIKITIGSFEEY